MKRYLIKSISTPTEANDKYNDSSFYYIGKGTRIASSKNEEPCYYELYELGFKKRHYAQRWVNEMRSWNVTSNSKFWEYDYEIVEFEI